MLSSRSHVAVEPAGPISPSHSRSINRNISRNISSSSNCNMNISINASRDIHTSIGASRSLNTSVNDSRDINPSHSTSSKRQGNILTTVLSHSLSSINKVVDNTIATLLQDNDVILRTQHPHWAQSDEAVVSHALGFKARNQRLTPLLRRAWAVACLAGMLIWLLVDVTDPNADGLVPGIRDSYVVNSVPFGSDNFNSTDPGTTTICTCTYNSDVYYSYPPYSILVPRADAKEPISFRTFLSYCSSPQNLPLPTDIHHVGTNFTNRALDEYVIQLTSIRLMTPTTAVLLSNSSWSAARFGEALRAATAATAAALARIQAAPIDELPSNDDLKAGLQAVARIQASFGVVLGRLLNMPDDALTVESVDPRTNQTTSLDCTGVPQKADLPMALSDWCRVRGSQVTDNTKDCHDSYQAYMDFCAPALCQTLGPKTPYLQAMQIMSAIGGLYSIISMFAFALLWRTIYCSLERKFELDAWVDACCVWCARLWCCCCSWKVLQEPDSCNQQQPQPSHHKPPNTDLEMGVGAFDTAHDFAAAAASLDCKDVSDTATMTDCDMTGVRDIQVQTSLCKRGSGDLL